MVYFDTVEKRIQYIVELLTNEPQLDVSVRNLDIIKKKINIRDFMKNIKPKLKYVSSGGYGHTFHGYSEDKKNHYGLKVVAYSKNRNYGTTNVPQRPENVELEMLKLLGQLVINKETSHIVLVITNFMTPIDDWLKINLLHRPKYVEFIQKYQKGSFHDDVSILISEWADRGDLGKFLKEKIDIMDDDMWRVLLFQLISCLATIQIKYPAFRHNDMKANNILVQRVDPKTATKVFNYYIGDQSYCVQNIGVIIKLWDFDFACIKGVVDNLKVEEPYFLQHGNISSNKHRYYDIHYFFNTLQRFIPKFYERLEKNAPLVKDFIERIIPPHFRDKDSSWISAKGRLLTDEEYTTPQDIIEKDVFFNTFRYSNAEITSMTNITIN